MGHSPVRRATGATLALLTAATGLFVGLGTTSATAAAPYVSRFSVNSGFDRTVPLNAGGHGGAYRPLNVSVFNRGYALQGVKLAVNGAALKGFAELSLPAGCAYTTDHLHELCTLGDLPRGVGAVAVGVRAVPGAKAGQSGRVRFKVTAANTTEDTAGSAVPDDSVKVTVADGPDLAIGNLGSAIKTPAGATTAVPLHVSNLGNADAKGVVVYLHDQYGIATVPGNFSNCVYEVYAGARRGVQCTFPDAVVKAGETYKLSTPISVALRAGAHGDAIFYGTGPTGDGSGAPTGVKGTGSVLTLVRISSQAQQRSLAVPISGVDIDERDNFYTTDLTTGITADLAGVGGALTGRIGTAVSATVGVRNSGNTTFSTLVASYLGKNRMTAAVFVAFPSQVAVVSVPRGCYAQAGSPEQLIWSGGGDPHVYECLTTAVLKPGAKALFTFRIKPLQALNKAFAGVVADGPQDPTADYWNNAATFYISAVK